MNPAPDPSVQRRLAEILGVAAAYFATGKLGLLLAIPPGYATAIWPPSGIALSALLLLGSRAWPGVFLGSFLVNVTPSQAPAVAAAIGGGAVAQALLGAFLVRRFLGMPLELLRVGDVARFILLGGPVSCVAGATVGVATLVVRKLIQVGEIPFSWWTWWVGDVIGVAVVAPLVLIAFGQPREIWRRRAVPVAVPLAILLLLASALFIYVSDRERARIASRFNVRSKEIATAIHARLGESTEVLRSLEGFHAATPQFNRSTFRTFVDRPLSKLPSLQALSWNPRVSDAERADFERGGPDGSDGACRITERDAKERLVPAPRRSEYVPVRYVEPYETNATIVGFDVSSGIVRYEAMKQACDTGLPAATRTIRLMQDAEPSSGLLLFLPIYSKAGPSSTSEERRRSLVGYFAGVIRLKEFFAFIDGMTAAEGIDVEILDKEGDVLRPSSLKGQAPSEIQEATRFQFGGRDWSVVCRATPAYVSAARSWRPWGVLAAGMSVAGLLGALLLAVTGRAVPVERSRRDLEANRLS